MTNTQVNAIIKAISEFTEWYIVFHNNHLASNLDEARGNFESFLLPEDFDRLKELEPIIKKALNPQANFAINSYDGKYDPNITATIANDSHVGSIVEPKHTEPPEFKVTICRDIDELPTELRDDFEKSFFEDSRSVLIIYHQGKILFHVADGGEPEDQYFFRDLSWTRTQIEKAYKLGFEDGNNYAFPDEIAPAIAEPPIAASAPGLQVVDPQADNAVTGQEKACTSPDLAAASSLPAETITLDDIAAACPYPGGAYVKNGAIIIRNPPRPGDAPIFAKNDNAIMPHVEDGTLVFGSKPPAASFAPLDSVPTPWIDATHEVIAHLNRILDRRFKHGSHVDRIAKLLKFGHSIRDIKAVVGYAFTDLAPELWTPEELFGANFKDYLELALSKQEETK